MSAKIQKTELDIAIKGEILHSNFDEFCSGLKEAISSLNYELVTDADFDGAGDNVKSLKKAEVSLKSAKDEALKQAEDIQKLFAAIDDVSAEARKARLDLDRQIKNRREERKREILDKYSALILGGLDRAFRPNVDAVLKGKKTIESMEAAARLEVDRLNEQIEGAQSLLDQFLEQRGKSLIPDFEALLQKPAEQLKVELERRVERAEAEAEKKRLKAKVEEAQRQKLEAETKAKVEFETQKTEPEINAISGSREVKGAVRQVEDSENSKNGIKLELVDFKNLVVRQFVPIKESRENMLFLPNREKAKSFADVINFAFKKYLEGGVE